jgi:O-antigen/teichoic acid export membrane protein
LIQKKNADDKDFSTVFWFNLMMSIGLYALLMGASPLIVNYFHEPMLTQIGAVVFLGMPINASMLIQNTLLSKQVRFKQLAKVDLLSMIISSAAAIIMAVEGCGVWALAWQPVILAASKSALLWYWSSWRPQWFFSFKIIRELFGYASSLLLSGLVNTCFVNVYSLVIPKLYPKRELGYFTQGNKICDPIVSLIYGSIQNATFPIFSGIQDEHERLIKAYRKSIHFTSFLTFPMMIGAICVAPALFHLLFKAAWWPAIPFFQLLCMGGCFTILTAINNNFIKVSGRSSGILKIEIYKVIFTIIAIALLLHQGVLAMVAGLISVRLIVHLINMIYTQRYTGYRFMAQLKDTLPYLFIALLMGAVVWILGYAINNQVLLLICQIITGVIVYFAIAYTAGSKILKESLELLKRRK